MAVKIKKAGAPKDSGDSYLGAQGKATVEVSKTTNKKTLEHSYEELLEGLDVIKGPHATVSFKAGVTRNLGDYNSARVDVMVTVPALPYEEGINAAYDFAKDWVDQRISELQQELDED